MRVVAVVVAYNRQDLLTGTLDALAAQTRPLDAVLVVDNASTDQSAELARAHPVVTEVLSLDHNTGGAGGFCAGIAHSLMTLDAGAGAMWLMDDDTAPTPTALEQLLAAWQQHSGKLALASSRVVWTDGRPHPMNSQRHRLFTSRRERAAARRAGAFPIRTASFVSVLVDGHAAWKHRLPRADYFIWNDDLEYTARLLRHAQGIAVPSSVTVHHTKAFAGSFQDPGERFYYEVRNKLWTFFQSPAFGPLDNTIYLLYTVLGWGRAIVRSKNRGILWRGLCRGLRHGLFRRPRPNPQVLAGQGQVSAEVLAIERRAARL